MKLHSENIRLLNKRITVRACAASGAAMSLTLISMLIWNIYFIPVPYDIAVAGEVINSAIQCQIQSGKRLTAFMSLVSEINTASDAHYHVFSDGLHTLLTSQQNSNANGGIGSIAWGSSLLGRLLADNNGDTRPDGNVMPWSYTEFDADIYLDFHKYNEQRIKTLTEYLDILDFVYDSGSAESRDKYCTKLIEVLQTDAEISDVYYNIICSANIDAMEKQDSVRYELYINSIGKYNCISNESFNETNPRILAQLLNKQKDAEDGLYQLPVFTDYKRKDEQ